jgi:hypothetical protein
MWPMLVATRASNENDEDNAPKVQQQVIDDSMRK